MSRIRNLTVAGSVASLLLTGVALATDSAVLETIRVSETSGGTGGNAYSGEPVISADGSTVVFYSSADNLVVDDTNGVADVFAYDVATGAIERVSVASDGSQTDGLSASPAVNPDGSKIVFRSLATNLDPRGVGPGGDLYLRDRDTTTSSSPRSSIDPLPSTTGL